jgi:murein DD-endopeptidase MepM/ murein hydrolase activator NlpD
LLNAIRVDGFLGVFKPRDLFLHDGGTLKRIRMSVGVQAGLAIATLLLLVWAAFATVNFINTAEAREQAAMRRAEIARMEGRVVHLQAMLDARAERLDERQQFLDELIATRLEATTAELRRLGLNPSRFAGFTGRGGPVDGLKGDKAPIQDGDPQFRALFMSWKKLDALEQGVISIPSIKPVSFANFTSSFGVRSDPFRGGAAMHQGIDLAGPTGTPIYATADGVVGRAEWANGYGNLVELEHGKGIQTRYGHLSKILVKANTRVKRGDLIALMGSTGRSTGSHLHYEVRIDGRAVNPLPFLQSTDYLLAVQRRAATQIAQGGPDDQ